MNESGEIRFTARIPADVARRLGAFCGAASVSRNRGLVELLRLGLDADTAGIETSLHIQSQLKRELNSLRGLVVAAVDSSDVACMLTLFQMIHNGDIEADEALSTFTKARGQIGRLKQAKKQKPVARQSPADDLMEGLEDD